jgi:hypothetical protein
MYLHVTFQWELMWIKVMCLIQNTVSMSETNVSFLCK